MFSAGIDLMELYDSNPNRLEDLWFHVQKLWWNLYGSKKVYIAALNVRKKFSCFTAYFVRFNAIFNFMIGSFDGIRLSGCHGM